MLGLLDQKLRRRTDLGIIQRRQMAFGQRCAPMTAGKQNANEFIRDSMHGFLAGQVEPLLRVDADLAVHATRQGAHDGR